ASDGRGGLAAPDLPDAFLPRKGLVPGAPWALALCARAGVFAASEVGRRAAAGRSTRDPLPGRLPPRAPIGLSSFVMAASYQSDPNPESGKQVRMSCGARRNAVACAVMSAPPPVRRPRPTASGFMDLALAEARAAA